MTRLIINLPDEVKSKLEQRAIDCGRATVEQYVEELVLADAEGVDGILDSPSELEITSQDELEKRLLQRLADNRPDVECTPEFWKTLRNRVQEGPTL